MSLLHETKELLHRYGVKPRKKLGQSFVTDRALLERMVAHADLKQRDIVLEIGAGLGFLTELLAKNAGRVIAIEVDSKLLKILSDRLSTFKNVEIVYGDILKIAFPKFTKVVSNPPYAISSPLIFRLLEKKFDRGILTFQEEFARRLVAQKGTNEYGRLTVMVYYYAEAELLEPVSEDSFYPSPNVASIVVYLKTRNPPFRVLDEGLFSALVRALFTQRNRKVKKALDVFFRGIARADRHVKELVEKLPFLESRVEQLAPEDFGVLSNAIYENLITKEWLPHHLV
jgi:16S rRNA (adenine1518-N6/adenine1519-N6)-dimethyltransferase